MSCEIKVNVKLDPQFINMLTEDIKKAAKQTIEDARDDLVQSQTVPRDSNATMQNDTFTILNEDESNISATLVFGVPYARYQYFGLIRHGKKPNYKYYGNINYQKGYNPYARSHWLEPYADGVFLTEHFNKNLKEVREGG